MFFFPLLNLGKCLTAVAACSQLFVFLPWRGTWEGYPPNPRGKGSLKAHKPQTRGASTALCLPKSRKAARGVLTAPRVGLAAGPSSSTFDGREGGGRGEASSPRALGQALKLQL